MGILMGASTFAQQGSVLLGGNLLFNDAHYNATANFGSANQWYLEVTPMIGYQFSSAWTAGAILGYAHIETHQSGGENSSANSWSAGPFVRYTHAINSWVSVYGQLQGVYYDQDALDLGATTPFYGRRIEGQGYPALLFNIKNGFALNISLGGLAYEHDFIKGGSTVSNTLNLTFGNTVLVGVSKNFGGHRKGG
jgi:hypothetical protein